MGKKKTPNELRIRNSTAEFLTFAYKTGGDGVEARVLDGTIWLSQKNMGLLFDASSDNIGLHMKNIFAEGELSAASVTEDFSATATDGKNYRVKHYNLDAINRGWLPRQLQTRHSFHAVGYGCIARLHASRICD
jgi:hypothetical protein